MTTSILKLANLTDCQTFATTNDLNTVKLPELLQLATMFGLNFAKNPKRPALVQMIDQMAKSPTKITAAEIVAQHPECFNKKSFVPFVFNAPNFDIPVELSENQSVMNALIENMLSTNIPKPAQQLENQPVASEFDASEFDASEFDASAFESALITLCESANVNYKMNDDLLTVCMDTVIEIATRLRLVTLTDVDNGIQICSDIFATLQTDLAPALEPDQINLINDVCLELATVKFNEQVVTIPIPVQRAVTRKSARTEPLLLRADVKRGDIITYLNSTLPCLVLDNVGYGLKITSAGTPICGGQRQTVKMQTAFYLIFRPSTDGLPDNYENEIFDMLRVDALKWECGIVTSKMNNVTA